MSTEQTQRIVDGWLEVEQVTDWSSVLERLDGHRCCWADADGLHVVDAADVPDERPGYCSHLWAWADGSMIRIRLDADRVSLVRLSLVAIADADPVRCLIEDDLTWREPTGASAALRCAPDTDPASLTHSETTVYTIIDGPRLAFIASASR